MSRGAIRYVKLASDGGNDAQDGTTWETAKATVAAAVASLPLQGGTPDNHFGVIQISDGVFDAAGLEWNGNLWYNGRFPRGSGLGGGTELMLPNNANDWLIKPTAARAADTSLFQNRCAISNLTLNGNQANQSYPTTVTGINITFTDGNPATIVRASGDFGADGYVAGGFVEVKGSASNDGMYEIGSVSGATLNLSNDTANGKRRHELINEGPVSGVTLRGMNFGLVKMQNGGWNTFFRNILFRDARLGLYVVRSALNIEMFQCNWGGTGWRRGMWLRTYGTAHFRVRDSQIDQVPVFCEPHRNSTGSFQSFAFQELKAEGVTELEKFLMIRPLEGTSGNPYLIRLSNIDISQTSTTPGTAVVWERGGSGVGATVLVDNVSAVNIEDMFRSLKTGRQTRTLCMGIANAHWASHAVFSPMTIAPFLLQPVPTANLPAAGASNDGLVVIEDAGAGNRNLIIYAGGQRFRIDGGSAF